MEFQVQPKLIVAGYCGSVSGMTFTELAFTELPIGAKFKFYGKVWAKLSKTIAQEIETGAIKCLRRNGWGPKIFTHPATGKKISRQRFDQLRRKAKGKCAKCRRKAVDKHHCRKHKIQNAIRARERYRRLYGKTEYESKYT